MSRNLFLRYLKDNKSKCSLLERVKLADIRLYRFCLLIPEDNKNYKEKKDRSSHRRCSVKKGVLRNFAKFTGKHLYQSLFFNKIAGLRSATLLKKKLWHRCLPVNFAKFLRAPFLQNISRRLLLKRVNTRTVSLPGCKV